MSASDSAELPDAAEPEVLMIGATDLKAHPTACSLNKGGGMTSKLHGVCDSKGGRLRLHLREGQCSDFTSADGDQGYDRDKIRKMLAQQGIPPCIPPRRCRKKPVHYSKSFYRKGHKIENLFSRLKD